MLRTRIAQAAAVATLALTATLLAPALAAADQGGLPATPSTATPTAGATGDSMGWQ
ncbi:hypothetical protein [Kitasatospora sp. NPDC057015]|uniref:hypothetical protein n=1 Tax=Kitasatospora sp. NPDC057015 TaxID=3346001 RepID=UPI00362E7D8F